MIIRYQAHFLQEPETSAQRMFLHRKEVGFGWEASDTPPKTNIEPENVQTPNPREVFFRVITGPQNSIQFPSTVSSPQEVWLED